MAKAQVVRLLDVAFIGPLMFVGGTHMMKRYPLTGMALAALGVSTVWYNGRNYLRVQRAPAVDVSDR